MSEPSTAGRQGLVRFTGARSELLGIMVRGYLGMLPTLGLYRFWMVTWKRRFYWSHTEIDGDTLEYTGNAMQLLIGFMMAVVLFIPGYALLFLLSTQFQQVALIGYPCLGALLWFLIGYAIYRTRDFRLSRTIWRGVRFDQKGSAIGYAVRRFLWSVVMIATAGLVYPFMAGNLWNYRYRHTWFGDRQFTFKGSWRTVAGPYYAIYFLTLLFGAAIVLDMVLRHDYTDVASATGNYIQPKWPVYLIGLAMFAFLVWGIYFYRGREITRMFSSICIGDASVTVRVRGRAMFAQFLLYGVALAGAIVVFAVLFGVVVEGILQAGGTHGTTLQAAAVARVVQGSFVDVLLLVVGYLALLATFAVLGEVILNLGYWRLVAQGAVISGVDSLKSVRASGEDPSLMGEGIANALNLGSY